jgi:hypothetical protein
VLIKKRINALTIRIDNEMGDDIEQPVIAKIFNGPFKK